LRVLNTLNATVRSHDYQIRYDSASSRRGRPNAPPRHKVALLSWAGAWTVITLILRVLDPVIGEWPLPLRTLVLSALMVVALTWLVMPSLTRMFAGWLAQAPLPSHRANAHRC
jgi:antibiotic biosynthesis monooxygenase (ABM) superfamily enzyme